MKTIISDNFASVKNVIFDLGNVILDVNPDASQQAFIKRGVDSFEKIPKKLFDEYETGEISSEKFRDGIRQLFPILNNLSDLHFDSAWNAMLGAFSVERLNILLNLKSEYRTFLLSNTNEIHVKHFSESLQNVSGHGLENYFEKIYYSNRMKMRKPNPDIFLFVLQENNLIPNETLFIDDSIENIQAAQQLGIQVLHLQKGKLTLEDMFPELI